MEPNLRDTPLRRFNTFWWGLGLFVVFGIACFILITFLSGSMTDVDTERGQERLVIKDSVDSAQAAELKVDPTSVFPKLQNTLNASPAKSDVAAPATTIDEVPADEDGEKEEDGEDSDDKDSEGDKSDDEKPQDDDNKDAPAEEEMPAEEEASGEEKPEMTEEAPAAEEETPAPAEDPAAEPAEPTNPE